MTTTGIGAALSVAAGSKVVEKICDEIFSAGKDFFKEQKIKKSTKMRFEPFIEKFSR